MVAVNVFSETLSTGQTDVHGKQQYQKVFIYSMSPGSIDHVKNDILSHLTQMFYTEVVSCLGLASFTEKQVSLTVTFLLLINIVKLC